MAKGTYKTTFKDAVYPKSSGASDLELEGGAKLIQGDFEVNGQKVVIIVGDGELYPNLNDNLGE